MAKWLLEYVKPPSSLTPPEHALRWMQSATVAGWVMAAFMIWALGFGAAIGFGLVGGGFARADDLSRLTLNFTCSSKHAEIERKRSEIYLIKREIETMGASVREIDRQRLDSLTNALNDEVAKYSAIGCDKAQ